MIKLTAGQASTFNSSIIANLIADPTRPFPIKDAFRLSEMVRQIQASLKNYNEQLRILIEKHDGEILKSGRVNYKTPEARFEVEKEMMELNKAEIEITGKKLTIGEDWPKLSLAEADILSAIVNHDGKETK